MVDPTRLKPFTIDAEENHGSGTSDKGDKLLQVIVETPKGSHNKYSWDATQKIFVLKTALPSGMVFPYDFGFVPQTQAPDGDPLDVLVMMDAPAFPGCAMMTRLIGVIEGEQVEEGEKPTRNDRLVAVAETTHMYAKFTRLKDMPKQALKEIEEFFVNYHKLQGKRYRLLGIRGQKAALRLIGQMRKPSR
jgi:inorganic pyrophosphatase